MVSKYIFIYNYVLYKCKYVIYSCIYLYLSTLFIYSFSKYLWITKYCLSMVTIFNSKKSCFHIPVKKKH